VPRLENAFELPGQRTGRRWAVESPLPQVAEGARERTLGAGEKNRERLLDLSAGPTLLLEQRAMRRVCIDARLGRPKTPNPPIEIDSRPHD
jgi:hypothetical protein